MKMKRECPKIKMTQAEALLALQFSMLGRRGGDTLRTEVDYYVCPYCSRKGLAVYHTTSQPGGLLRHLPPSLAKALIHQYEPPPEVRASLNDKLTRKKNRLKNENRASRQRHGKAKHQRLRSR